MKFDVPGNLLVPPPRPDRNVSCGMIDFLFPCLLLCPPI